MHSEFSIVDGIVRVAEAAQAAHKDAMPALALTDLSNLFGMVKFYKAARGAGLKPIIGCDVWISNELNRDQPTRLMLLCQSYNGYLRLCDYISRAYRTNQHRGRAEIKPAWFENGGSTDLIALSGGHLGDIGQALLQGNAGLALDRAEFWSKLFPQRFYIELQRYAYHPADLYLKRVLRLAAELKLPIVATHPIQFLKPDDFKAHEARVCIAEGYVLGDRRRPRLFTEQQYFKSQAEMAALFSDLPEALINSVEIAKRCNFSLQLGKTRLPQFPTPAHLTLDEYFREESIRGLHARLATLFPDETQRASKLPTYRTRLDFEIRTIIQMGFPGYFLIVADFINWAKKNGVPVGPGRGSGAGSLVAYSLGITDLDPLRYDLLFERFLNPERVSLPDFDVDFCQDGRERVIEYVKQKFGADSVSQIVTFGTMAARAVVRDVGRVLDLPYSFVDQLAKLIPFELGMTLKKAREQEAELNTRAEKEEEVSDLLELAERLEGITRNVGMHAGGVLIAPGKLTDYTPIYCAPGQTAVVSQFDKDDVEQIGLVKFDFLGLRTLTILDWTARFINQMKSDDEPRFDPQALPLDDPATYKLLNECNTTAVFQLESRGMRDLIKQSCPDCFEDIIALVALFRPGPMNLIPDFVKRKRGLEVVKFIDPRLEPILKPTYGVMVYQEQVMQIAQVIGGYSLGSADLLRRAMGKKKPEEMALHRDIFIKGALERGLSRSNAESLFNHMEKFAEYGFNKSHSAAYALIAYQTAYVKTHYPAAFMAATLSSDMDDTDKVQIFFQDALANGLEILPPDINFSEYRFTPTGPKQIRYGLGALKGTGESAITSILKARSEKPFEDIFDFCERVDTRLVNKRVMESLIRGGAFDSYSNNRASLLASAEDALDAAEKTKRALTQNSLFGGTSGAALARHALKQVTPWSYEETLLQEKKSLGYYFSGHPYSIYAEDIQGLIKISLKDLTPQPQAQLIAGIIAAVRTQFTRRGKMAIVTLDDGASRLEVVVFSELYDAHRSKIKEDQFVIVSGKVTKDDFSGGLRATAEALYDLAGARQTFAKRMQLFCNGASDATKLMELLAPHRPGPCLVEIDYENQAARCHLALGAEWQVKLNEPLMRSLTHWLDKKNVKVIYQ